jgi:hypothetical protein
MKLSKMIQSIMALMFPIVNVLESFDTLKKAGNLNPEKDQACSVTVRELLKPVT